MSKTIPKFLHEVKLFIKPVLNSNLFYTAIYARLALQTFYTNVLFLHFKSQCLHIMLNQMSLKCICRTKDEMCGRIQNSCTNSISSIFQLDFPFIKKLLIWLSIRLLSNLHMTLQLKVSWYLQSHDIFTSKVIL